MTAREQAEALFREALSPSDRAIARVCGVTHTTVRRWRVEHGVEHGVEHETPERAGEAVPTVIEETNGTLSQVPDVPPLDVAAEPFPEVAPEPEIVPRRWLLSGIIGSRSKDATDAGDDDQAEPLPEDW